MGILEMIPPKYWRSLKRELLQINLDELPMGEMPWVLPAGGLKAFQREDALSSEKEKSANEKANHCQKIAED